ncbi:hypothetical protein K439DRAFT_845920 [Ramaria rubella]|nr:hypothetical protein K439DRAFT_845920 [Ramaria rubella]
MWNLRLQLRLRRNPTQTSTFKSPSPSHFPHHPSPDTSLTCTPMPWDFCRDLTIVEATLSWMDIQVSRVWIGSESHGSSQVISPFISMFLERSRVSQVIQSTFLPSPHCASVSIWKCTCRKPTTGHMQR